jgi:hypothetical protein
MSRNLSAQYKSPKRWCSTGGHLVNANFGGGNPFICVSCSRKAKS